MPSRATDRAAQALRLRLAVLAAAAMPACGGTVTHPSPGASPPAPQAFPTVPIRAACTDEAGPRPIPPGAAVAVMATSADELALFLIEDLTGCWVRLDPSDPPDALVGLAAHPSGRFVFASGRVAPGRTGVAAYKIVAERGALDGLGASVMEQQWWDRPGSVVASEESVYMLGLGPYTGYHGGFWRWSFGVSDGGLAWRGPAAPARDPFFLVAGAGARTVYLGTEVLEPRFRNAAVALQVGSTGALRPVGETALDAPASAAVDPSGRFVWLVTGWSSTESRIEARRVAPDGTLGAGEARDWGRRLPVAHPSGRVLYTATAAEVEAYAVDPALGTPTLVARLPYAGGDRQPLAVHPSGRFLYAVSSSEVRAFRVDSEGHIAEYGRVAAGGVRVVLTRVP